ncbi:MAG TPA: hypothetical protein VGE01_06085 [Fimbriimonas sp.]
MREALTIAVLLYLAAGYAASQYFALTGRAMEYAKLVDIPQIRLFSLVLLVAAAVLAFVHETETEPR